MSERKNFIAQHKQDTQTIGKYRHKRKSYIQVGGIIAKLSSRSGHHEIMNDIFAS